MSEPDPVVVAWQRLPRRIYLDTSTLQAIFDYGDVIFENEPYAPSTRAAKVASHEEDVDALRAILDVNERAGFEFVITDESMAEVDGRNDPRFTQWVWDVRDSWEISVLEGALTDEVAPVCRLAGYSNISSKDRSLLEAALRCDCDAFLTMERRLASQAGFIQKLTGLRVLRPPQFWAALAPFAALFC